MEKHFLNDEEKQELKDLIFDTLGDMADPRAFVLDDYRTFGTVIILQYPGLSSVPNQMLQDEWHEVRKGTKFEDISLFCPC